MIVFDLRCAPQGHVFEGWFGSTPDYDDQQARGLVACPLCGSADISKAAMAPAVGAKSNASRPDAAEVKRLLAEMAAEQKRILAQSQHVGAGFADEARAIHLGEAEARPIHGRATIEDTKSLLDEGIAVAPLPFPVIEAGEEN